MKIDEDIRIWIITSLFAIAMAMAVIVATNSWGDITHIDYNEKHHQEVMMEVQRLESSFGKNLCGKDGEWGPYQFKEKTFNWMKKKANMEHLTWFDHHDQVTLADWALRNPTYQRHWSTHKRAEQNVVIRRYK